MPAAAKMQFFVVTRGRSQDFDLQRVDMAGKLQEELTQTLLEQAEEFTNQGVRKVPFCATYTPSPDTITQITPYETPTLLLRGLDKPQEFHKIQMPFPDDGPAVKAILGIDDGSMTGTVGFYFQYFDKSHVLQRERTFLFRTGMFHRIIEPGITISSRLTAVIVGQDLLFRTYSRTNQFLDLSAYFREASDTDIKNILEHRKFLRADPDVIIKICGPSMRKKFSAIVYSGVLDHERATPDRIQDGMKHFFGIKIDIKIDKGSRGRRLVFPNDPTEIAKLLEYLTDGVYTSHLTGEPRTTNSHRPLEQPSPRE